MKVVLSENKMVSLLFEMINEYNIYDGNADYNPYTKKINSAIDTLEKLINSDGVIMSNLENGKDYIVYEIYSLSKIIGKRYCLCRLIKDDEPYGAIYTKPLGVFKMKNY